VKEELKEVLKEVKQVKEMLKEVKEASDLKVRASRYLCQLGECTVAKRMSNQWPASIDTTCSSCTAAAATTATSAAFFSTHTAIVAIDAIATSCSTFVSIHIVRNACIQFLRVSTPSPWRH